MGSCENSKFPVSGFLKASHLGLHSIAIALIVFGLVSLPDGLVDARWRTTAWLCMEIIYFLISICILLVYFGFTMKKTPKMLIAFHTWVTHTCPNLNFFFYLGLSTYVLWGVMMGCNIPYLFYSLSYSSTASNLNTTIPQMISLTKKWDWLWYLRIAVAVTLLNSIFHFVSAFYPPCMEISDGKGQDELVAADGPAEAPEALPTDEAVKDEGNIEPVQSGENLENTAANKSL